MSKRCEDCGTRLWGNICSNCQEELAIVTYQSDGIEEPLSNTFVEKVEEQKKKIAERKLLNNLDF